MNGQFRQYAVIGVTLALLLGFTGCQTVESIAEDAGVGDLVPETSGSEDESTAEDAETAEADAEVPVEALQVEVNASALEAVAAFDPPQNPDLYPVAVDGQWGYMDEHGEIAIEPEYDVAFPFSDGWGRAERDGTFYFLNPDGEVELTSDLDFVDDFSDGLAVAREVERTSDNVRDGIFGYINREGEWVMPPQFKQAYTFSDEWAPVDVNVGDEPEFGQSGEAIFAYITPEGSLAVNRLFDGASYFNEGRGAVEDGFQWGYIDRDGDFVVEPEFSHADTWAEGRAPVTTTTGTEDWFHIDESGTPVGDDTWEVARPFGDGLAPVAEYDDGLRERIWHYIDRDGNIVDGGYQHAETPYRGLRRVLVGSENAPGEYLSSGGPPSFGERHWDYRLDFYRDYEWTWIDENGDVVWGPEE